MAIRKEKKVSFVVTIPFIAKKTPDGDFYRETVRKFQKELNLIVQETVGSQYKTKVYLNSEKGHYLLLGGSCVELGEEGVVGRGNKTRGLISGMRPYTMETPYGKNPVYHVGKVYATITDYLSRAISEHFDCSCNVNIITRIGDNLYSPYQIFIETNKSIKRRKVHNLVRETLEDRCWTERILNERLLVPKVGKQNLTKLLLGGL